ncbi:uncharacterized protein LOC127532981 [Acanthochromis polyacanthus]|uniref:uncharacterized protein LOC127532981 n=1 Tax=Acanthochromis polyacanthus TaxID=80966 RepID=UPI00223420E6|nr:uncharacterized protein LOC127532981 [Acanthochromis polyacanthus]
MRKAWDSGTVIAELREAFRDRIPEDVSIELLMSCGNTLISPKLHQGQELSGLIVHKIFKSKAIYLRPSSSLPFSVDNSDPEDNCVEVDTAQTSTSYHMTTRARGNDTAKAPNISIRPFTRARAEQPSATLQVTDALVTTATQPSASQEAAVVIDLDSGDTVTQTPSNSSDDYAVYLSIMGMTSDLSDDEEEELNQAIMASLESHAASENPNTESAQEVLLNLASKIDGSRRCGFNINRTSVLDGALRGFRRPSYNPVYQMCIKFSDDLGKDEEAVDLGGPRREFLRLLMEALALSPMFEGRDGKLNLALDSSALREDRYFVAGQAIAVSLVHGGPPPGFIAPTLYRCLVGGTSSAMPVLEDIADPDLYEKVKKVSECTSLDDLIHATEPLQDYLANAGCLRPLKCIKDKDQLKIHTWTKLLVPLS